MTTHTQSLRLCLALTLVAMLGGCRHIGPRTVPVDRFGYAASIAESWKQQTLLNIVKLRYMDLPVFLDVSSIVSGYSLQTGVGVGGTFYSDKGVADFGTLSGQAIYTDRPTITYVPMTGEKFLRGLLTPIDPKNVFFLLQSGYGADFVLALTVESLNGLRNRSATAGAGQQADPEFVKVLGLLREVQLAGGFGMRVEEDKAKNVSTVIFSRRVDVPAETAAKAAEIVQLLKLSAGQERFKLVYSPMRGAEGELAVNSRSMIQIMGAFASCVEVPEEDVMSGCAVPFPDGGVSESDRHGARIRSGKEKPPNAYAAVRYRNHWFWIDDADLYTKRSFTAIMFFFSLADTGEAAKLPLITIPAQ